MIEILIDNKDGNVWDVSELGTQVTWKTSRIGKASTLSFSLVDDHLFKIANGDVVQVKADGKPLFYGYGFSLDDGKDALLSVTAYDQTRYLMDSDTYVFSNVTATEVIRQIASDIGLKIGYLVDTQYRIPTLVEDGKKLIDIICKALDLTLIATGRIYVFYDDCGQLTLRNAEDMKLDFVIGDGSLLFEWKRKRSIDNDTYNRIKLVRDNQETGKRDVYVVQDSANMAKWGRLQFYQSVDENMNAAQIDELLNTLIAIKNRETRSLKVDALGDIRVRAGCFVVIQIEELGINQYFLVDECSHTISGAEHTMALDLKVI